MQLFANVVAAFRLALAMSRSAAVTNIYSMNKKNINEFVTFCALILHRNRTKIFVICDRCETTIRDIKCVEKNVVVEDAQPR